MTTRTCDPASSRCRPETPSPVPGHPGETTRQRMGTRPQVPADTPQLSTKPPAPRIPAPDRESTGMATPEPAQRHRPVLRDRVVELLEPALTEPGSVCVDGTLGIGGHAEGILERCPQVRVVGIDRDQQALDLAGQRLAPCADRLTRCTRCTTSSPRWSSPRAEDRRRRPLRPRRLLAPAGRGGPRLRLPRRRAARHADGPVGGADRRGGPQHLRRQRPDPDPARLRRGAVRPPDRARRGPGPRRRAVQHVRTPGRAAPVRHPRGVAAQRRATGEADLPGPADRGERGAGSWETALPAAIDALAVGGRIAVLSYHSLEDRITKRALTGGARSSTPAGLPVELRSTPHTCGC